MLLERKKREILIKCITYFQKIIRVHVCGDKHLPSIVTTQRDVGGWMVKRQRKSSQVSPESSQSAMSRRADPGLNHGLCRHHRAQVEGVEGLMSYVPQVVTRKGCMPAPRTRLQHLVDSKILSKKN